MDDLQFFPTPRALAERAWSLFKNRDFVRVLEASAGDGHLADAHPWSCDRYYNGTKPIIDCCEIDVTRHAILRSKGYSVVGLDFLEFGNAALYGHLILNPPFASGAAHVLKAFNAIWDGEVVAIINADTLRNPCTRDRLMLVRLIEQFGSYEIIPDAFAAPEAERKANVDVALVYLKKVANVASDIVGDLIGDLRADEEREDRLANGYAPEQALALPNSFVENSVITFKAALQSMKESVRYEARARHYAALIGETLAVHCGAQGSSREDHTANWVRSEMMKRYDDLKDRCWANLLRSSDVTSRLSSAAQSRLEHEFESIKKLEYTETNIRGFLCGLMDSQGKIQEDMMCDVFDLIGKYHSQNTVYAFGWKSNSKHRTLGMKLKGTRFILPGHSTGGWRSSLSWDSTKLLSDFDKVMALLDGVREPAISLVDIFRDNFRELCGGERIYGSYFSVRYWPLAGTIHFFPARVDLIDRLNRVVGRRRAWLPMSDNEANAAFWNAYEKADKFDKEIRQEIAKKKRRAWNDHPFDNLNREETRAAAENEILDAISSVFERNGIQVENLLEERRPPCPQLELLAA